MSKKIDQKIVGYKVVSGEPAAQEVTPAEQENNIIQMH